MAIAIDVSPSQLIRARRLVVAAFVFDPAYEMRWTDGITRSEPARPGPMQPGLTVVRTAKFLGRTFTYRYEVRGAEPERWVDLSVARPFPMATRYTLADSGDDTPVTIHAVGTTAKFFSWATPCWPARFTAPALVTSGDSATASGTDGRSVRQARLTV